MAANVVFEWDESNRGHIAVHRVSCREAEEVILNQPASLEKQNKAGEDRLLQVGETNQGRILVVVSTYSGSKIRIITAWDAKQPLARYWRSLQPKRRRKNP